MLKKLSLFAKHKLLFILASVILGTLLLPLFSINQGRAGAISAVASDYGLAVSGDTISITDSNVSLRWIDAATIEVVFAATPDEPIFATLPRGLLERSGIFSGGVAEFEIEGWDCDSSIKLPPIGITGVRGLVSEVVFDVDFKVIPGGGCQNTDPNRITLPIADTDFSAGYFRRVDQSTIGTITETDYGAFTQSSFDPNIFLRENEENKDGCQDRVVLRPGNKILFFELSNSFGGNTDSSIAGTSCDYKEEGLPPSNFEMPLVDPVNESLAPGTGSSLDFGTGPGQVSPSCETTPGVPLSFALCPLLNGALRGIDLVFEHVIDPFLRVSPVSADPDNEIFVIWSSFRTIGNIIIIFALLFAVFGQSIGGGLVDAYTVKKIMPRILVAAILINLSIYIVAFMIDVGNVVGRGIGQLITAPIGDESQFNFGLSNATTGVITGSIVIGLVSIKALLGLSILSAGTEASVSGFSGSGAALFLAFFVLIPILLLVLAIFFTLVLRQAIIVFLAIVSPVAVGLWSIPATDRYAKTWASTLFKAILIYPIVVVIFAVSSVLSYVLFNTETGDTSVGRDVVSELAAIVILFAPMALIPFSFRIAGGIFSTLTGSIIGGRKSLDKLIRGDEYNKHQRYQDFKSKMRVKRKQPADRRQWFRARSLRGVKNAFKEEGAPEEQVAPRPNMNPSNSPQSPLPSPTPLSPPTGPASPPPGSPLPPPTGTAAGGSSASAPWSPPTGGPAGSSSSASGPAAWPAPSTDAKPVKDIDLDTGGGSGFGEDSQTESRDSTTPKLEKAAQNANDAATKSKDAAEASVAATKQAGAAAGTSNLGSTPAERFAEEQRTANPEIPDRLIDEAAKRRFGGDEEK